MEQELALQRESGASGYPLGSILTVSENEMEQELALQRESGANRGPADARSAPLKVPSASAGARSRRPPRRAQCPPGGAEDRGASALRPIYA
jgi:hypothetical protein